jgi:hypothetical protein
MASREFSIDESKRVVVNKKGSEYFVTIEERASQTKTVTLPAKRWAVLITILPDIENSVNTLKTDQSVKFSTHLGGGYFTSVNTGFQCVDIREFYYNKKEKAPKPTKHGIALNLVQWDQFKEIIQLINIHFPRLSKTQMCIHGDLDNMYKCSECRPFSQETPPPASPVNFNFGFYQQNTLDV